MEDPVVCADGHSYERDFIQKWLAMGKRSSPKTNMSLAHTTLIPNLNLRNIIESIRVRMPAIQSEQIKSIKGMQDLEAIVTSLMEDQGKLAVTCIDPTRPAAPYTDASAPPPPPESAAGPMPVILDLLRHDSKEVCERALGLVDALVANHPQHRDAVWHHGGIPLVVNLLRGSAEQTQRACTLLRTLASRQREAQMAVAWSGAIPVLVDHLNHDVARVRTEAARALWSLAENNVDNQTTIVQQEGIPRLVPLLDGAAPEAREPALLLLLALAPGQQDALTRAGAIAALVSLLHDSGLRELAAAVMKKMAERHADNQSAIGAASGAVPKLIQLLSDESPSIREASVGVLHSLVAGGHNKNVTAISRGGGIRPCMELLRDENPGAREDAAGVLSVLATNADNRAVIAKLGAIPLFIELVEDTEHLAPAARTQAAAALGNLAVMSSSNKEAIGKAGGIQALVGLLKDSEVQVREKAASAMGTLCVLSDQNKAEMVRAGAIPLLVELLRTDGTKKPATVVLRSLAEENEAHKHAVQEAASAAGGDLVAALRL
ncbi:unnamed protein product [Effrenium voratum]|uniref:RING-type E3 ubiquitin transferase n=1 Tax=Effrenium voratum TaxID=2562239 RepID=A0AA36NL12_9DINO|nr:unnamed protein product [Effrenium voratum]CAJ1431403.1 unnamed protein product [Effrenium voratum]